MLVPLLSSTGWQEITFSRKDQEFYVDMGRSLCSRVQVGYMGLQLKQQSIWSIKNENIFKFIIVYEVTKKVI